MHRDLKSKNVLIEQNSWIAKLCDFGFARETTGEMTFKVGTDAWMAPEVMQGNVYDYKADVFSFGIILYELMTRSKPFKRLPKNSFNFEENEFLNIIKEKTAANPPLEPILKLSLRCIEYDPNNRPSFKELLNDFQEIYKNLEFEKKSVINWGE